MSTPPNVLSSGFTYQIVCGGHDADPPEDQSSTCKVVDPLRHGSGVNDKDMPFITMLVPPTRRAQNQTNFQAEPGTCVATTFTTGDPSGRVIVGMPCESNQSAPQAGNDIGGVLSKVIANGEKKLNINRAAPYTEKMDKGALVRTIENELGDWSHSLTKGLATHVAYAPMAGQFLPQIKQIDTAIQQFAAIPGLGDLANLPGKIMSVADMFNSLNKNQKKQITKNMPPELVQSLESMMNLITEGQIGHNYVASGRVHEETFIANMIDLLSQATTLSDLLSVIERLRTDTTLHGLDKLDAIEIKANTPFGEITQTLDINGNMQMSQKSQDMLQQAIKALTGLMNSAETANPAKKLFNDAEKMMNQAFQSIPNNIRPQMLQDTINTIKQETQDDILKQVVEGGNPLVFWKGLGA
jgi:hypothetical protein